MKPLRLCAKLGALTLVVGAVWVALLHTSKATANDDIPGDGASYLLTVTDSSGTFVARNVMTLHADHTMAMVDSDSGGPTAHFTEESGSWRPDSQAGAVGRTLDFNVPQSLGSIARLDFKITFQHGGRQIAGTFTVAIFPLQGDPFGTEGTDLNTFKFTGVLITP